MGAKLRAPKLPLELTLHNVISTYTFVPLSIIVYFADVHHFLREKKLHEEEAWIQTGQVRLFARKKN